VAEQVRLPDLKRPELVRLPAPGVALHPKGREQQSVLFGRAWRPAILAAAALLALASPASDRTNAGDTGGIEIVLSPAGDRLGPITARTPFSAAELRSLFAGAVVTEATDASEGELYPMLRIADGDRTLLEIRSADGKAIYSVEIMPGARVDNLGVRHGETYAQVFGAGPHAACEPGVEEQSGQIICPAPATSHVSLVFDGSWDGPDGELPPPEELQGWTVQRIVWRP
jgi:Protein of unknown function (DUF1131)